MLGRKPRALRACVRKTRDPGQPAEEGPQGARTKGKEQDPRGNPECGGVMGARINSEQGRGGEGSPGLWIKQSHSQTREGSWSSRGWL